MSKFNKIFRWLFFVYFVLTASVILLYMAYDMFVVYFGYNYQWWLFSPFMLICFVMAFVSIYQIGRHTFELY